MKDFGLESMNKDYRKISVVVSLCIKLGYNLKNTEELVIENQQPGKNKLAQIKRLTAIAYQDLAKTP